MKRKHLLYPLIGLWVLLSIGGYLWVKNRYLALPDDYFASFSPASIQDISLKEIPHLANEKIDAVVVHFIDDNCPCSRFSEAHILALESRFNQSVQFYRWPEVPDEIKDSHIELAVPASPAVAIWSASGELVFFGPYSSGVFCGEGDDFVELALGELLKGSKVELWSHDALGCFCPWRREVKR